MYKCFHKTGAVFFSKFNSKTLISESEILFCKGRSVNIFILLKSVCAVVFHKETEAKCKERYDVTVFQ